MPYQYGGEIDYSSSELIRGSYRLQRLAPREGAGDFNITGAGGQERSFDLISRPFNLSKSVLSFTYTAPATGNAALYNKLYMDCLAPIRQLQLQTRSGVYLCDLNDVGNITKMMWKPETSIKDFLSMDNHDRNSGAGSMLQKCNGLRGAEIATTALNTQAYVEAADGNNDVAVAMRAFIGLPSVNVRRHDDLSLAADGKGNPSVVNVSYNEAKYFSGGDGGNQTHPINVKINLGMLYNTIFALDKTLMFPEILTLRIVWASASKIYYYNDDLKSIGGGALTAGAGNVAVSNLNLFLATETNPNVIQALQAKIASGEGMFFNIDYPMVYKNTISGSNQNVVLRFDAGHGRRLRKLYHCVNKANETKNTCYDIDNRNGAKITSFYTTLDGARQQEFDVRPAQYEDYMILKPKLEASALMNCDVYQYNWFWCDYFDNNRPFWSKDQSEVSGLDLSTERRWEFISTIPGAAVGTPAVDGLNHYTLAVLQRTVVVKATRIYLDNVSSPSS